jgi:hypothetical protein
MKLRMASIHEGVAANAAAIIGRGRRREPALQKRLQDIFASRPDMQLPPR